MKKRKKNRIELILISILFVLSSILVCYQVYDSYQDEEKKIEKEAVEYKLNSYNKLMDMLFLKSYMLRKYDLNGNIRKFALEKINNPLINYKLQNQLKEDYNFLGRSNCEFFIINTKRGFVIETTGLNTVDKFSKEHKLERIDRNQLYKRNGNYLFISKSNVDGIYYALRINKEFF